MSSAYLVLGLGRSGIAAARELLRRGEQPTLADSKPLDALDPAVAELGAAGATLVLGAHDEALFERAETIVVSPGVPLELPGLAAARRRGARVCCEIDLAPAALATRTVGITGSNGKSTTTALVSAMLGTAGRDAVPCGNFGVPLLDAAQGDDGQRWYALELSSFQLDLIDRPCLAAAILLNVQSDHLDRHGSFERYRAAKHRIAALRGAGAPLVAVADDPHAAALADLAGAPVYRVSTRQDVGRGAFRRGDELVLRVAAADEVLLRADELPIPGEHNELNVLAAAAACRAIGVGVEEIRRAVADYRALPHRLELVASVGGVDYVDDSKATNVGSTVMALRSFPARRVILLLGGQDKDGDFAPLARAIGDANALPSTFGAARDLIADALEREGLPRIERHASMLAAVGWARAAAREGDIVLLSPACASFDEFSGFAARGDAFAAAVRGFAGARQ